MGGDVAADTLHYSADEYDYLSLVNEGTHGIPPLVTKTRDKGTGEEKPPVAGPEDRILYVNTGAFTTMKLGPVERDD